MTDNTLTVEALSFDDVKLLLGHAQILRIDGWTEIPAALDRISGLIERHIADRVADARKIPAGAVPLPEVDFVVGRMWGSTTSGRMVHETLDEMRKVLIAYGDAREAAAVKQSLPTKPAETEQSIKADAYDMIAQAFERSGRRVTSIVDAVESMLSEPAGSEAVDFAAGNWRVSEDAFNIYHDNFDSDVMLHLSGGFESCQHRHDFANAIARRLTGAQADA